MVGRTQFFQPQDFATYLIRIAPLSNTYAETPDVSGDRERTQHPHPDGLWCWADIWKFTQNCRCYHTDQGQVYFLNVIQHTVSRRICYFPYATPFLPFALTTTL